MRRDNENRERMVAIGGGVVIGVILGISIGLAIAVWLQ